MLRARTGRRKLTGKIRNLFPSHKHVANEQKTKPIGQLAIIVAIADQEIGTFIRIKRSNLGVAI